MNWMKTSPYTTFLKLWGVIEEDLDEGYYTVNVTNAFDVSEWDGEKHIVLATASKYGGRSFALSIALFVGGSIALISSCAFLILHFILKSRKGSLRVNDKEVISTERATDTTALQTNF